MLSFVQLPAETKARCARPRLNEMFSPRELIELDQQIVGRNAGARDNPLVQFLEQSKARVLGGRPEMNVSSSTIRSSEYFRLRNDGMCRKRPRGRTWMIW
jgi:hypothetical protein